MSLFTYVIFMLFGVHKAKTQYSRYV